MGRIWVAPAALLLVLAASSLAAEVVIFQAAASLRGLNPFFSDVRAFNTSYSATLEVDATYRCFIGPCPGRRRAPDPLRLAPRESRAFDDIVANAGAFDAHDTGGGIEFEYSGSPGRLVITLPALLDRAAELGRHVHPRAAGLSGVRELDPDVDPPRRAQQPRGRIPDEPRVLQPGRLLRGGHDPDLRVDGAAIGSALTRTVPPHSGLQISGVFEAAGASDVTTSNATIVVNASAPLFTYAAVIDGRTADPIFVVGANNDAGAPTTDTTLTPTSSGGPDQTPTKTKTPMGGPSPTATSTPTRTPTAPGPTMTPTPTASGPTVTPTAPGPSVTPTATAATTSAPTFTITVPPTIAARRPPARFQTCRSELRVGLLQSRSRRVDSNVGLVGNGHSTTSDVGSGTPVSKARRSLFQHTFHDPGRFFPVYYLQHGSPGGGCARNGDGKSLGARPPCFGHAKGIG